MYVHHRGATTVVLSTNCWLGTAFAAYKGLAGQSSGGVDYNQQLQILVV